MAKSKDRRVIRDVNVGGAAGELVSAAYAWRIEEIREQALKNVRTYQHKQSEADTVPFLDVYSDDPEVASRSQGYVYNNLAIFPEMWIAPWSLENVATTVDFRSREKHFYAGTVTMRYPRQNQPDGFIRIKVEITKHFAESGNVYKVDRVCRRV